MTEGVDFKKLYLSTTGSDLFRMTIELSALEKMILYFIGAANAFQTNMISDHNKRHYVSLPSLYKEWFLSRWPNHPLKNHGS